MVVVLAHYWIVKASRRWLVYGRVGTHDGNFIGRLQEKARDDL